MNEGKSQSDNSNSLVKPVAERVCKSRNDSIVKNCPFDLEWIFGFNPDVPLINLTTEPSSKVFASVSGNIFKINSSDGNKMRSFVGHEKDIFVLASDATGRFIVSADTSGVINIWDASIAAEFSHPIRSVYEPYRHVTDDRKLSKLCLSADGKNLITASDGRGSVIKLWRWSFGTAPDVDNVNESFELPAKYDNVVHLRFSGNENDSTMFVVTCSNGVVFGRWDVKQRKLQRHFPARTISISFQFIDTIFIENSHRAMSITACGCVVVWSDVLTFCDEEEPASDGSEMSTSFKKEFVKSIKLFESPLRVIKSIDGFVVICDIDGRIRFYDKDLRILFWCPSHDSIDSIITISFDLNRIRKSDELEGNVGGFRIRDFLVQTNSEIFSVDVAGMEFNRIFYRSDDFITAIDLFPSSERSLVCCANHSGRIFMFDYEKKAQVVENRLKLQKRKGSTSDIDIIETPHVTAISFSPDGRHLLCGLGNGAIIALDPNILHELKQYKLNQDPIVAIKFSPDSDFVVVYDEKFSIALMHYDRSLANEKWRVLGKVRFHTRPICDVLYISASSTGSHVSSPHKVLPRLISLAQDRQIVEYDLTESLKQSRGLAITFAKRIFQSALPVSMTLVRHGGKSNEEHLLIADTERKFKLFDKNTFEILATFLGPIYDCYVEKLDSNTSFGPTAHSNFFIFTTNKHICLYALPIDGNPFRSLGIVGHCRGVKGMTIDTTRRVLFTIGNECQSLFMWNINTRPLFDHLEEGGSGLKPYCDLIPGGKFGLFLQHMHSLYFYMLMMSNRNSLDDRKVKEGLDVSEVADFMRGLGFFPSDYEIECLLHELEIGGTKKVPFEELFKLFINHSHSSMDEAPEKRFETSMKVLLESTPDESSAKILINKSQLVSILTEEAEKVNEKDAEFYLKEVFKTDNEISLNDLMNQGSENAKNEWLGIKL